jgi:hypothetical protein
VFRQSPGVSETCTIEVSGGTAWSFVAVPGAIGVIRTGFTPRTKADLFIATSSLCRS